MKLVSEITSINIVMGGKFVRKSAFIICSRNHPYLSFIQTVQYSTPQAPIIIIAKQILLYTAKIVMFYCTKQ